MHVWPYRPLPFLQVTDTGLLFIATLQVCKIKTSKGFIYLSEKKSGFLALRSLIFQNGRCCGGISSLPWAKLHLVGDETPLLPLWKWILWVLSPGINSKGFQLPCSAVPRAHPLSKPLQRGNYFGKLVFRLKLLKEGFEQEIFVAMCVTRLLRISEKAGATWGRAQNV